MEYKRDTLLRDLRESVIEVFFTKVNGEQRAMICTLKPEMLPPSYLEEKEQEKKYHKENKDVIAAWDVQKGGWRSFRIDSVSYVQIKDGY